MFTPGQVAEMLALPASTLRNYVKEYGQHLSDRAIRKRGRRFTEVDIATITRARELLAQGNTPEEVRALLGVVSQEDDHKDDTTIANALALVPSIGRAITELTDNAASLRTEVDELKQQHQDDQQQLNELRTWREEWRQWHRMSWRKRIRTPPPE